MSLSTYSRPRGPSASISLLPSAMPPGIPLPVDGLILRPWLPGPGECRGRLNRQGALPTQRLLEYSSFASAGLDFLYLDYRSHVPRSHPESSRRDHHLMRWSSPSPCTVYPACPMGRFSSRTTVHLTRCSGPFRTRITPVQRSRIIHTPLPARPLLCAHGLHPGYHIPSFPITTAFCARPPRRRTKSQPMNRPSRLRGGSALDPRARRAGVLKKRTRSAAPPLDSVLGHNSTACSSSPQGKFLSSAFVYVRISCIWRMRLLESVSSDPRKNSCTESAYLKQRSQRDIPIKQSRFPGVV
ncbi:hypothetical protein DFH07DRAFT_442702 [Mycena maculata]|uniref:Uncharacterized protein n=1 Tax=Mycena maculata TaxID=230809 RepID=A0AAD7J9G4_9AGAR|nr:hypothetical protein DFH07DRAFT_442702 [Mycena maculata]